VKPRSEQKGGARIAADMPHEHCESRHADFHEAFIRMPAEQTLGLTI